jgi:serine/threonine-protein kinase
MGFPSLPRILLPGDRVDRYELLCPIGQGGMGQVWAVRLRKRHGFEKLFALKALVSTSDEAPQRRAMFLDEARLASRVSHPNVCEVVDFGDEAGLLYMVLEWVDGESLFTMAKAAASRGMRVPLDVAVRAVADAARGLHSAHELTGDDGASLGIVHRDVSLQNILVRRDGVAKVIDFGVAKATSHISKTDAGTIKGKLRYLAPEQILDEEPDRRTDVRALGIVLLSLLEGRPPYDGLVGNAVVRAILDGCPPGRLDDPRVDRRVRAALACALDPDRARRFATAAAFADAIESVVPESVGAHHLVADFAATACAEARSKRAAQLAESRSRADVLGAAQEVLVESLSALVPPETKARLAAARVAPGATEIEIPVEVTMSGLAPPHAGDRPSTMPTANTIEIVFDGERRRARWPAILSFAVVGLLLLLAMGAMSLGVVATRPATAASAPRDPARAVEPVPPPIAPSAVASASASAAPAAQAPPRRPRALPRRRVTTPADGFAAPPSRN